MAKEFLEVMQEGEKLAEIRSEWLVASRILARR
jgi:hypothetical protein